MPDTSWSCLYISKRHCTCDLPKCRNFACQALFGPGFCPVFEMAMYNSGLMDKIRPQSHQYSRERFLHQWLTIRLMLYYVIHIPLEINCVYFGGY